MVIITAKTKMQQIKPKLYRLISFKSWSKIVKEQWLKGTWMTGVSVGIGYPLLDEVFNTVSEIW